MENSINTKLWNKNFTIMVIGQFISLFGNSLQRYSLSLFILDITGSATIFSLILALTFIPQIFLAPFGGAFADRFSKKKIMVVLDTCSGLMLLLFTIYLKSSSSIIAIAILMCIMAVIQSIYDPSVRASIPAITAQENLEGANSIVSVVSSLTALVSPIAAGFLYGLYGIEVIFIINVVSFLFSAVMELFLHIPHKSVKIEGSIAKTFVKDIGSTFSYLFHKKPIVFQTLMMACSFNLFLTPIYTVGYPYMEKVIFGVSAELYGISEGIMGAGMIVGALLTGIMSKKLPFWKLHKYFYFIIVFIVGLGIATLPFVRDESGVSYLSYWLFTGIGFLFAAVLAVINIMCMTFMQLEIPMEYMGKAMALVTSLSMAFMPVGQLIFGKLYDIFATSTWWIYAIVTVLSLILTLVTKMLLGRAIENGSLKTTGAPGTV